jgi:hypothetical protein
MELWMSLSMSFTPYWKQWKNVKENVLNEDSIRHRAVRLWEELGKPKDRDEEIWFRAKDQLMTEYLRANGVTGNQQEDIDTARRIAIMQFVRRRHFASKFKKKDSGTSLYFYCKDCGVFVEELPQDYLFGARTTCSQCYGLRTSGWMEDAMKTVERGNIPPLERDSVDRLAGVV